MENFNQYQRIAQKNAESHLQALLETLKYAGMNPIDIRRYEVKGKEYIEVSIRAGIDISQILYDLNTLYEFSGKEIQYLIEYNDKNRRITEEELNQKLEDLARQGVPSIKIDNYKQKANELIQKYRDLGENELDVRVFLDINLFNQLKKDDSTKLDASSKRGGR